MYSYLVIIGVSY